MYKLLLFLIMVLLLVVLLLTASVLLVVLYGIIIITRNILSGATKKERTVRDNSEAVNNDFPEEEDNSKPQGMNRQERYAPQQKVYEEENWATESPDSEQYDVSDEACDRCETGGREGQPSSVMGNMAKDIVSSQNPEAMTEPSENIGQNGIRLRSMDTTAKKQFGIKPVFIEAANGKINICQKNKNIYYVVPFRQKISAKDYEVGDIGLCFTVDLQLLDGKQYRITKVAKKCRMTKDKEGHYIIIDKGELMLEEISY